MALEWEQVIVHSVDPVALGQWWAEALDWAVVYSSADEFEIRPEPNRLPALDFVRLDESKKAKSRLHLDFRPDDQDAEVARLVAHGAQRVDIGQGDQSWVVLADPKVTSSASLASDVNKWLGRGAGLVTPRCGATGGLEDGGNPEEGRRLLALHPSIEFEQSSLRQPRGSPIVLPRRRPTLRVPLRQCDRRDSGES